MEITQPASLGTSGESGLRVLTQLGKRDAGTLVAVVEATVNRVFDDEYDFGNHFNLAPTTEAPRNAFLPLKALQKALLRLLYRAEEDLA